MRLLLIFSLLAIAGSLPAQFNSDCKDVKRRKIKTATALKIYGNGDTVLHRFTYDEQGRMTEWYHTGQGEMDSSTYDRQGNLTSYLLIVQSDTDQHPPIQLDTVTYERSRYDSSTRKMTHHLRFEYENGSRTLIVVQHYDTTVYYTYRNGSPVPDCIVITSPFDSLQGATGSYIYGINYHDSTWSSLRCDTVLEFRNVTVSDRHGNTIAFYQSKGGAKLELLATYENEYNPDGTLKKQTEYDPKRKEQRPVTHVISKKPPFNSLMEIEARGKVKYTHHK